MIDDIQRERRRLKIPTHRERTPLLCSHPSLQFPTCYSDEMAVFCERSFIPSWDPCLLGKYDRAVTLVSCTACSFHHLIAFPENIINHSHQMLPFDKWPFWWEYNPVSGMTYMQLGSIGDWGKIVLTACYKIYSSKGARIRLFSTFSLPAANISIGPLISCWIVKQF